MESSGAQRLAVMLRTAQQVHKRVDKRLEAWWAEQSSEERTKFLLDWCPYMPLAPDKPYLYVEGEGRVELEGVALMCPELNQKELIEGDRLINLLREVMAEPEGTADAQDCAWDLCMRNMTAAMRLVGQIRCDLSAQEKLHGMVCLLPGERFGNTFVMKQMAPSVQDMLDKGAFVRSPVFDALFRRLDCLLGSLAMCMDHFRVEILRAKIYSAIGPQMGCAYCGALEAKEGFCSSGKLQACAACGIVFYCSKECQKADWKEHKPHCNPTRSGVSAARPTAADGAADAGASSAAVGAGNSAGDA